MPARQRATECDREGAPTSASLLSEPMKASSGITRSYAIRCALDVAGPPPRTATCTSAHLRRVEGMSPPLSDVNRNRSITSVHFNLGRLLLEEADGRVRALNEYFTQHAECLPFEADLACLYSMLRQAVMKGPIRFTSLEPAQMRRYWDGVVMRYASYAARTARREDKRRSTRLVAHLDQLLEVEGSECETEGGSEAAMRDLVLLFEAARPRLTRRERQILEAVRECLGTSSSLRFIAARAGCSKTSVGNLLKKLGQIAPSELHDRWAKGIE